MKTAPARGRAEAVILSDATGTQHPAVFDNCEPDRLFQKMQIDCISE